jgi:hypothetical protein
LTAFHEDRPQDAKLPAWLLQLAAELRSWDDPQAREWWRALEPLEVEAAAHQERWPPELHHPRATGAYRRCTKPRGSRPTPRCRR